MEKDVLVNNLHNLIEEQKLGAQIRSRTKWVEEGERSIKYFYSREKKHISNNATKQLKRENGKCTTSDREMLEEQHNYYKKLYTLFK